MNAQRIDANTRILVVSNGGGAVLSFLLSALIGRSLGEEGLGAYAVALAWTYPLSLLVEFGLGTLLTRDAAADLSLTDDYLRLVVVQRLIVGGAVTLALILCAPLISADSLVQRGVIISAPMVILLPFFSTFSAVYRAHGSMRPIPYLNIGMLLAQVILTVFVFLAGGGVLAALAVNTLTSAGQLAAAWCIWHRGYRNHNVDVAASRSSSLRGSSISLLRAAFPFALAGVFAALQLRLNLILIESISGSAQAGYFTAASRFTEAAKLIPNALFGALMPALAALATQPLELRQVFRRSLNRLSCYGIAAGAILFLASPTLISLVYGSRFDHAVVPLIILSVGLIPALLRGGYTLYHYAFHREGYVNYVNAFVLVAQLIIAVLIIPFFGAIGGAASLVISDALAFMMLRFTPRPVVIPEPKISL